MRGEFLVEIGLGQENKFLDTPFLSNFFLVYFLDKGFMLLTFYFVFEKDVQLFNL